MADDEKLIADSDTTEPATTNPTAEPTDTPAPAESPTASTTEAPTGEASPPDAGSTDPAGTSAPETPTPVEVTAESPATEPATASEPAPSEPVATEAAPATPSESEAPAPVESSAPTVPNVAAATEVVEERKRPKLNPTGADQARPVPNLAPAAPALDDEKKAEITGATPESTDDTTRATDAPAAEEKPAPPPKAAPQPVDVPRAVDGDLGDDLEAEIAAAMSADTSEPVAAPADPPPAAEEGSDDEDATPQTITDADLEPGLALNGKILSIHGDTVIVDIGTRMNGAVSKRQFQANRPAEVGQIIRVVVDKVNEEEGLATCSLPKGVRKPSGNWDALAVGQVVECYVNKTNKGGLEIAVSGIRGFLPASQIDLRFVENMDSYVGQKLQVEVTEVNPKKRNLVVSRRKILQSERAEAEKTVWQNLDVGQTHTGTVKTIKPYGAFVDIGGTDGFLHVGEISWNRINDPGEVLAVGQQIDVKILKLDRDTKKIGLGMKQLEQNPWSTAATNYPDGTTVKGKVTRVADFGAFVELEKGVEGLIHISQMDHARVRRVTDVCSVGQEVEAQVLEVDGNRRRISLSIKALKDKPVPPKDEDLSPGGDEPYVRKHKGPLKGGTSNADSGGGLFGNPNDFGG